LAIEMFGIRFKRAKTILEIISDKKLNPSFRWKGELVCFSTLILYNCTRVPPKY